MTFLCTVLLAGCAHSVKPWNRSDLVGYRCDLDDPKQLQSFTFSDQGYVLATLGEKEGWLTAPVLTWTLTPEGVLVIKDHDQRTQFTFRKIATDTNTAIVLASAKRHLLAKRQTWLKLKE